ncbi:MAG: Zn-ribbon domain-containing OB-fold protein [Nitrososphaerales archaeon]
MSEDPSIYNIAREIVRAADSAPKEYKKSLPGITPLSKPFWQATTQHKFLLQKCTSCGTFQWYPKPWCIECGSRNLEWTQASGLGEVYSFTIIREVVQNSPAFEEDLPYALAEIDLKEGPRFVAQLKDVKPEEAEVGMRVKVTFIDATPEISIPKFERAEEER